jgi:hypothetical protein
MMTNIRKLNILLPTFWLIFKISWTKLRYYEVSSIDDERYIIMELIREGECVTMKCPDGSEMEVFYMHDSIIDVIGVTISFTLFECEVLQVVNVAPSQFHQNS